MPSIIYEYQKKYILNYFSKNKEKIIARTTIKVYCDICSCDLQSRGVIAHKKTKKHLKNIEKLEATQ
jgi:hypothetical protein